MEAMVQEWTDSRLDELSKKVDHGFERVDNEVHALRVEMRTEFSALRAEMNGARQETSDMGAGLRRETSDMGAGLRREMGDMGAGLRQEMGDMRAEMSAIHERIDSIQHTLAYGAIAMAGAILAGFAGICTLIATSL